MYFTINTHTHTQEELQRRPKISTLLSSLVRYDPIQPNSSQHGSKKRKKKKVLLVLSMCM